MNSLKLHYEIKSEGSEKPWIIFLHGLLGSLRNWLTIARSFENKYQILLVDQRGHGKSPKPAAGYAPSDFAGDLKILADDLGITRAILIGHSMGGRNALEFASKYPQMVEKLVLEDIGPGAPKPGAPKPGAPTSGLVNLLKKIPVPFENKRAAKEYLMGTFPDHKLGTFLYTHITDAPSGSADISESSATWDFLMTMVEEIISKGRNNSQWDQIRNLEVPTLIVHGENSEELGESEFRQMLAENKLLQGAEIKGAGHWVHFDKPEEFTQSLKEFLK